MSEEGDGPQDFMSVLKQTKAKQEEKKVVIKSKKEKEKEKKEKEKQRKKELAAKKKAKQQEQKAQQAAQNQKNADDAAKAKEEKNSKKADSDSPSETPAPASAAAGKKGKGKKINPAIAALRKQMELRKQQEEEERLLQEEEERLAKEEEEKRIAEEKQLEEQKKLKKEKEKARIERLKAEGKFLTKKQKEEKKLQERRKQQLLQSGNVSVAGLKADGSKESTQKKKIVYGDKKKKSSAERAAEKAKKEEEARKKAEEEAAKAAAAKAEEEDEDDDLIDDWEAMALDDDEEEEEQTATGEDWSAKAEEEEKESSEEKQNESSETPASTSAEPVYAEEIEEISTPGAAAKSSGKNDLRSPICCILGHVDTGKTKLLDKIRQTNVQGGEAGGITQQIGATYFPMTAIKQKTKVMEKFEENISFQVPGLLIIDTPGHESFTNLRSRGSSLCNIAILVIDIMHGLEQQTIESIRLLRDRKAPFIVALNKIDRLYGWEVSKDNSFRDSFAQQTQAVKSEFEDRLSKIKVQLAEQGLNSELYFQNKNMAKFVSIVPTSAVTGEGVPDLLWLLLELTTKRMSKQLMYLSEVEATILEVKVVEGFGYTIDVVLNNGILREGDRVVLCGLNGPIVTNIRALLTPQPLRELRIKSDYVHNKEVKAALGVKIAANDLEKAVAGSRLLVVGPEDDEEELMDEVMDDLTGLLNSVDSSGRGVTVQASTLGSLEALLSFLKDMKIPVMSVGLGPVFKRDVMKATTMLDKAPEYAVMLCFDVKIDKEAEQYAEEHKITIFNAEIIYHLFDAFTAYQEKLLEEKRKNFMEFAIFPCVLNTIQIINKRNPMIIGVDVAEGSVRIGTPICAVKINPETKQRDVLLLGKVVSLEVNHNSQNIVKKGQTAQGVAMRLEGPSGAQPVWGRHVDEKDKLYSLISRKSIDTLKDAAFRDQVPREDWLLIKALKPVFDIK